VRSAGFQFAGGEPELGAFDRLKAGVLPIVDDRLKTSLIPDL
jgi:hypothetical protein